MTNSLLGVRITILPRQVGTSIGRLERAVGTNEWPAHEEIIRGLRE